MASQITTVKLGVNSAEYENKLKRATSKLLQMENECRKVSGTMAVAEKSDIAFARSLGNMQTVAKTAKGRMAELNNAFTEAALLYKRLTNEEKNSPFGRELNKSINQLRTRLQEAKKEMVDVQKSLGGNVGVGGLTDFRSVLGDIGSQMGMNSQLMSVVTSGTIAYTAAIGGAVVAVAAAAKAWADYNSELAKQDQITTVTTGLSGGDAQKMTDWARSLADVYNVDFREAINGANTLMHQFGLSADEAMTIMEKGMQGMIQGDGPKLLQMIQQYTPAFRDAGVSASELVAVINNTEGGIFTDQNMQAITMGIKNIRLMKNTTKDALKSIGVDADDMSKKLNDGTMSVFEALKIVSTAIQNVGSGSKAAGEVMQDVFGRQGVTAGTNLGKAIASLNTNLDETSKQTGEVGQRMSDLQKADEELQGSLRKMFGLSSEGWENMKLEIETKAIKALSDVINAMNNLIDKFKALPEVVKTAVEVIGSSMLQQLPVVGNMISMLQAVLNLKRNISSMTGGDEGGSVSTGANVGGMVGDILKKNPPKTYTSKDGTFTSTNKAEVDAYDKQMANIKKWSGKTGNTGKGGGSKSDPLGDAIARSQRGFNSTLTEDAIAKMTVIPELKGGDSDILKQITSKGENLLLAVEGLTGLSPTDGKKTLTEDDAKREKWRNQQNKGSKKEENTYDKIISGTDQLTGGLANIGNGLEAMGVDLGEGFSKTVGVLQGILSVVMGIEAIVSVIELLNGTNAIPFFNHGGMVPQYAATGRMFAPHGTDTIPAMLTPGELVLNKAQQGNLSSQLNGNNIMSNLHFETSIREDKLIVMLNNGLRKRGKGTLMTTR